MREIKNEKDMERERDRERETERERERENERKRERVRERGGEGEEGERKIDRDTGCSLNIVFFSQEFSTVCHLSLASTRLLLVVQKRPANRSDCTLALR